MIENFPQTREQCNAVDSTARRYAGATSCPAAS